MQTPDRARGIALTFLAAVAGSASVGIAALAHAGAHLCGHHLAAHAAAVDATAAGMASMASMHAAAPPPETGVCPILVYAALVAAALCLLALGALLAARRALPAVLADTARLVLAVRTGRLTGLLAAAGALPLAGVLVVDGAGVLPAAVALTALAAGAFLTALALAAASGAVLALARRLVVAIASVLRLLAPGAGAPRFLRLAHVTVRAGVRLARRRPSRAPPVHR